VLYRVRITDLMTRAHELQVFERRARSIREIRAHCRDVRERLGEAIHVEAEPVLLAVRGRRTVWAVA
jgi:hypothetical protein